MGDNEEGGSTQTGDQGTPLNLHNLLIMDLVALISARSKVLSELKFTSDTSRQNWSRFYALFMEVFDLTSTMLDDKLKEELTEWISSDVKTTKASERLVGVDKAGKLIDYLTNLGILKLFSEPVDPPFMLDFAGLDEIDLDVGKRKSVPKKEEPALAEKTPAEVTEPQEPEEEVPPPAFLEEKEAEE
jgi:hypothetical protein